MPSYKGLSFPPRVGPKGGWVMSVANNLETTKIKESIWIILSTHISDRVMEVRFGSQLLDATFENMDLTLVSILKYQVEQVLTLWEPRIKVSNVSISYDTTLMVVNVRIDYTVLNLQIMDSTVVSLGGGR